MTFMNTASSVVAAPTAVRHTLYRLRTARLTSNARNTALRWRNGSNRDTAAVYVKPTSPAKAATPIDSVIISLKSHKIIIRGSRRELLSTDVDSAGTIYMCRDYIYNTDNIILIFVNNHVI